MTRRTLASEFALPFLKIPQPLPKPRAARWTIMTDLSLPLAYQASFLETAAGILDRVKYADHVGLNRAVGYTFVSGAGKA